MDTLPSRLKQRRSKLNLTQKEIADRMGVNRVTYTNWENGKRQPNIDKLVKLASELSCTVDYLLGVNGENVV